MGLLKDQLEEARKLRDAGFYDAAIIQADNVVQICLVELCRAKKVDTRLQDNERSHEREVLLERLIAAGVRFEPEEKIKYLRRARNLLEHPENVSDKGYQTIANSKNWASYAVSVAEQFLASVKV